MMTLAYPFNYTRSRAILPHSSRDLRGPVHVLREVYDGLVVFVRTGGGVLLAVTGSL